MPLAAILVFRFLPPRATPLMLIRLAEGHGWQRTRVPQQRIAPVLAAAVIAAEDKLFCEQVLGFDLRVLRGRAWRANRSGRDEPVTPGHGSPGDTGLA